MIAFDTNHLLRHVLQDEPKQCRHVSALLAEQAEAGEPILIVDLVIMESYWVLTKVYDFDPEAWCYVLESLLSDAAFTFESATNLRRAISLYKRGKADFSDYLILAQAQSLGAKLETFDKKLKRSL